MPAEVLPIPVILRRHKCSGKRECLVVSVVHQSDQQRYAISCLHVGAIEVYEEARTIQQLAAAVRCYKAAFEVVRLC